MALTHRYIDFSGGSDAAAGTSDGAAWKTLAYAYATITNANSWQLNLKSNADHVVSGPILPSYNPGWGTEDKSIHHVGYTATANDGGRWTIDCSAAQFMDSTSQDNMHFYNGKFKNWGTGELIRLDDCNTFYGVEFDGGDAAKECLRMDNYNFVANCWLHSMDNADTATKYPIYMLSGCGVIGNRIEVNQRQYGIRTYWGSHIQDNLILSNGSASSGTTGMIVVINGDHTTISGNVIVNKNASGNVQYGIYLGWGSTGNLKVLNNYVEGMKRNFYWGSGIQFTVGGGNVSFAGSVSDFYSHGSSDKVLSLKDDVVLTASGLMDVAGNDYRPNSLLREQGAWPSWGDDYADNQAGLFAKSVGWPQPRQNHREGLHPITAGILTP